MYDKITQLFLRKRQVRPSLIVMTIFASFALIAAFVLSFEKIHLLENPNTQLSCNFNLVLNCASVMKTSTASLIFGIPNSFFGVVGFTAALTIAVVLMTGAKLPRWMLIATQIGLALGWIFALWLFFQSVYDIQILCPWCLVVTASTTIMLFAMLRFNLSQNAFKLAKKTDKSVKRWIASSYDVLLAAGILVILTALVFIKFGDALFA